MRYDLLQAEGNAAQAQGRPVTDVIFDFGNVLLNWDPGAALVPRYDRDTIARFLDNEISGFYDVDDMVDEGGSVDDALAMVREQHGEQWAEVIRYYYDHTQDSLAGPIPGARMLIRDLKDAGIGVWGLSNWQKESFRRPSSSSPRCASSMARSYPDSFRCASRSAASTNLR